VSIPPRVRDFAASNVGLTLSVVCILLAVAFLASLLGLIPTGQVTQGVGDLVAALQPIAALVAWLVGILVALTWPAVVLIVAFLVLGSRTLALSFGAIWGRTKKLKFGDAEVEFTSEAAKQLNASADETFQAFRQKANRELNRLTSRFDVYSNLKSFVNDAEIIINNNTKIKLDQVADLRCTIYIEDVLFKENLWQIVDYYPRDGRPTAGRVFSTRFGIIGRTWRMEQHLAEGEAADTREDLIKLWGMTQGEATEPTRQRFSYICCVLRETSSSAQEGAPIALFFADSTAKNAFGNEAALEAAKIAAAAAVQSHLLMSKIQALRNELKTYAAEINPGA